MKLEECLESVVDKESFLTFVRTLCTDKEEEDLKEKENPSNPYSSGANGWQNNSIDRYLAAAVSWAEDSEFNGLADSEISWKQFAEFLYAGKIYE